MAHGNRKNLYLITLSVSIAFMVLGVSSSWSTPVLPMFKNNKTNVDINENEIATMFSMYPIGFATGSLATRYIADRFGRRTTILASAMPIFIGSLIVLFALKAWLLYITAFTWQCGTGMISTVIGYYFAEIADKHVRATLQLITGFTFKLGTFLTLTVGPFLTYDNLNYIMVALPVALFLLCMWIPETPYFYLKNGHVEAARRSLRTLRCYNNEKDLEDELLVLHADVKNEMKNSSSVRELFVKPQYRKAIVIATGLKLTQMMTGGVQIKQYLGLIMNDTKSTIEERSVFIIYGCVAFVVALMSSVLVDRVGRRPLLIYSFTGTGIVLAAVGFYFLLKDFINVDMDVLSTYSITPFICILLSNIISTLGFSSLILIIPAEIFPLNIKAVAMTSLNIFGCTVAVFIAQGYQMIKNIGGHTTVFFIFAGFAIGGAVFCYYFVIETKGKNLRDIQLELQGDAYKAEDGNTKLKVADNYEQEADENEDILELKVLRNYKI